jgi:hypothetical protein
MKTDKKNKILIGFAVVVGLFVVTNPTQNDFENYIEGNGIKRVRAGRTGYYLLFSKYQYNSSVSKKVYIGVFKNFIEIK